CVKQDIGWVRAAAHLLLLEVVDDYAIEHDVGELGRFDVRVDRVQDDPASLVVHGLGVYPVVMDAFSHHPSSAERPVQPPGPPPQAAMSRQGEKGGPGRLQRLVRPLLTES